MSESGLLKRKEFRLTQKDIDVLKKKASDAGMKPSEYLRDRIYDTPSDAKELRKTIHDLSEELNKIGVNINQIAYNNNSMLYTQKDRALLMAYMSTIKQKMEEVVDNIYGNH